jgi:hypothetical protein
MITRILQLVGIIVWLALFAACGDDGGGKERSADAAVDGSLDNASCPLGSTGCACAAGDRCGATADGVRLACRLGVCQSPECTPGDPGCACKLGTDCNDPMLQCSNKVCTSRACEQGAKDCPCLGGTCDPGLICVDNATCKDSKGREGGACLENGACLPGSRCDASQNVCVFCDLGSEGCACDDNKRCGDGLVCSANLCVSRISLPPSNPKCYTPCLDNLQSGDKSRACDAEGLLAGCIADKTCTNGSCVAPGAQPPSCSNDMQCPFFQTCLQGGCYSNCEINADCPTGLGCFRKVCRVPCNAELGGSACDDGSACVTNDGSNGFCSPGGEPPAMVNDKPVEAGGIKVSVDRIELSNLRPETSLSISSESRAPQKVTVHKLAHTVYFADGSRQRVEAPRDNGSGAFLDCDVARGQCPLDWLELGIGDGAKTRARSLEVTVPVACSGNCPLLRVARAAGGPGVRWQGELLVQSEVGVQTVYLTYVQTVEGRWSGTQYYFGSFGDQGLDPWIASPNKGAAEGVKNGLIQAWSAFRRGALEDWEEMTAVLTATQTEAWKFDRVRTLCSNVSGGLPRAVCYPHDNPAGVRIYTQNNADSPVPSGVTELPIALNLQRDTDATHLKGVIDSTVALQYPAEPAVTLAFETDPGNAVGGCNPQVQSDCAVFVTGFSADATIGGRYKADSCAAGFTAVAQPWLLSDFTQGTSPDATVGGRSRTECRDNRTPFAASAMNANALNTALSAANPAPDGVPRTRKLRLIDGALLNQSELFILFEETFPSFLPNGSSTAYGYMLLRREGRALEVADYAPSPPAMEVAAQPQPATVCSADLLTQLGTPTGAALVNRLLDGTVGVAGFNELPEPNANPYVHYLCEQTGVFDNGKPSSANDPGLGCPTGSDVTYFLSNQASLADEPCQKDVQCNIQLGNVAGGSNVATSGPSAIENNGLVASCSKPGTCTATLAGWQQAGSPIVLESDPLWRCKEGSYCDRNRFNLREGKVFYRRTGNTPTAAIPPLQTTIDQAFRYKSRFQTSGGDAVGFAPQVCQTGSDQVPYCYDPGEIEAARARVDCLLSIYADSTKVSALDATTRTRLETFLRQSFSRFDARRDGFERLYAELLTMLGDDAVANSFASRFDLAAASGAAFYGSRLELNGIDLSGTLGYEMAELYRGVQYLQLALDRMYGMGQGFATALSRGATSSNANFISPETVTLYLERLGGASSKKARAWSEIAKRYLALNRPDLARAVVEREYARTYLEGVLLSKLMQSIVDVSQNADKDQLRLVIEQAQRGYRMALIGMSEVYGSIDDGTENFGFPADYIPFPALDSNNVSDTNAYEVLAALTVRKIDVAATREEAALNASRTGKTDAATFQAELVRIRNTYEDQLADLCGTFTTDDGRVVPAISKYASLSQPTRLMGDPCGRVGNGQIRDAHGGVDDAALSVEAASTRLRASITEIQIERERVSQQCKLTSTVADFEYKVGAARQTVLDEVAEKQFTMGVVQRSLDTVVQGASAVGGCDGPIACVTAGIAGAAIVAALTASNAATSVLEKQILDKQKELAQTQLTNAKWITNTQCDAAIIDSNARTGTLVAQLKQGEIELLRANLQATLAAGQLQRLLNQAKRTQGLQVEAEQMLINTEAARNDPNVRIYRNDAVINADLAFDDAIRAAYRATRVFEYYTSQSYAKREQLYLIRMAGAGQYNLQNYVAELQNAFFDFEEQYGVPTTRVAVLSLRDDILQIPQLNGSGDPYTRDQRVAMMIKRLQDPTLIDEKGYLTIPFGVGLESLSPVTRVHKVRYIETDVVGSDVGDTLARVYLRQRGTGTILGLDGMIDRYAFPERLSVVNAFFNGSRVYGPEIYRNGRLRDRPVANSLYELVINQRDESVNRDIDLGSLTDIRLLVYYDDFTVL